MGAAVNMDCWMASRTERYGMEKAAPCRMATLLHGLLPLVILLLVASEVVADGNVTMESITIFRTHEWFGRKPKVYFQCNEESKVYLPDVLEKNVPYTFLGQESWQPLTTLYGTKCKRCGIYEKDTVKADDTFYEWELCPKAFSLADGRYEVFQDGEFNATLICNDCLPQRWSARCERYRNSMPVMFELRQPLPSLMPPLPALIPGTEDDAIRSDEDDEGEEKEDNGVAMAALILVLVLLVLLGLGVVAYTKWRQKQRAAQQARFVKMFEDDDDLDAELGLKDGL